MASAISSFSSAINSVIGFNRTRSFISASSRVALCGGVATCGKKSRNVLSIRRFVARAVEAESLAQEAAGGSHDSDQPESASPSDVLTMLFQAEGGMKEADIPTVTKALEEVEGVTKLKVQLVEGIASVQLTKQTTIQATGVASGLVETMQGSGFKSLGYLPKNVLVPPSEPSHRRNCRMHADETDAGLTEVAGGI